MTFLQRTASLFAVLACLQASCSREVPSVSVENESCLRSGEEAYKAYKEQRFFDAIEHADGACNGPDWELIFSSYMVLYLENHSDQVEKEAEVRISQFERVPSWFADPGPLLIALGEDSRARKWYVDSLVRLNADQGLRAMKKEVVISQRTFFESVIALIDAPDWKALSIEAKLQGVAEVERMAVRKAREAR